MTALRSIAAGALLLAGASTAAACIHGSSKEGKPFKGRVLSQGYEGIVLHAKGKQELILNVVASFQGDPKEAGAIGWVLALPAVPSRYDANLTPQVFADASRAMHYLVNPPKRARGPITFGDSGNSKGSPRGPAIKVKKINVGPYTVHQIEVLGGGAVTALNAWFGKHGFGTRDPKAMQFFVEKRYTFLCLRVKPTADGFSKRAVLTPLRVSFASPKPFFPLKFSSHAGTFPLSLYTVTDRPIDWEASEKTLQRLGFKSAVGFAAPRRRNYEIGPSTLGGDLYQLYAKATKQGFPKTRRLYFNHLQAKKVNTSKNPIARWTDDVWFETSAGDKRNEVRAAVRGILGGRSLSEARVEALTELGPEKARPALREILVTSTNEHARIVAAWLLVKLKLAENLLCARLLQAKPSPALRAVLGACLLGGGDARGFKPLIRGISDRSNRTPLSWRTGKPRTGDWCRAALTHFTGVDFPKAAQWSSWYSKRHRSLKFDADARKFR